MLDALAFWILLFVLYVPGIIRHLFMSLYVAGKSEEDSGLLGQHLSCSGYSCCKFGWFVPV